MLTHSILCEMMGQLNLEGNTMKVQILENEARALYLSASLLGDTYAEKREALEQIIDLALNHLNADEKAKLKAVI
jgi:hypothetical protein